jgi:hypothetical protein
MNVKKTIIRLLTFRLTREDMLQFNRRHFIAGLIGTWIVGMGRNWDHKNASLLQHLGVGSLIYIFILAGFIWLIVKPFFVEDWNYFRVVTFIGLTSFPAILYAIPVEKWFSLEMANSINAWFLAAVALWRLCLLYFFLAIFTRLSSENILVITLMPICLIITTLSILNLDHVVYNIMSGISHPSANDSSYFMLLVLTGLSTIIVGPLLLFYIAEIYFKWRRRKKKGDDRPH